MVPRLPWQLTSTLPGPSSSHHSFALPSLTKPKPQLTKTPSIHPQILAKTLKRYPCMSRLFSSLGESGSTSLHIRS
jgi:hypothetical protein